MGLWERIRAALGREAAEAKDIYDGAAKRLEADLDRRERELAETPEEKLARMASELETQPDGFDEVRARLARMRAEEDLTPPPTGDARLPAASAAPG